MLTILTVGYPLSPLGADAVGGAEQVASAIDRALVEAGHRSLVIARADSHCRGELIPLPVQPPPFDTAAICRAHEACRTALATTLARESVDVLHFHGTDFANYLPAGHRAVATLHRWPDWYPQSLLRDPGPCLTLQCVSAAQRRACPGTVHMPVIANGVDTDRWRPAPRRGDHAVIIGRICPEKGVHLAIQASARAHVPLVIAGDVFPYEAHVLYFNAQVAPRVGSHALFIGPVAGDAKRELLSSARCVIVASTVPETSSLAAMEALASGVPVVAFRTPALEEIIEHGRTGFLVHDVEEMARAIARTAAIDGADCRSIAVSRCSLHSMTAAYLAMYCSLAASNSTGAVSEQQRGAARSGPVPAPRVGAGGNL